MDIQVEVKLQVCIEKTDAGYSAFCEQLDVYAEGSSKRKAEKNIREALSLFLETCMEMGTFNEVLVASGFGRTVKRRRSVSNFTCENMKIPVHPAVIQRARQAHAC